VTRLRAVAREDLSALRTWRADERVWSTALGRRFPITSVGDDDWYSELNSGEFPSKIVWSVVDERDQLLGLVQLSDIDWLHRTCWFGIWLGPENWGRGHGLVATELAIGHAFEDFNLRQARLHVLRDHHPALELYSRLGFQIEGTMLRAVLFRGEEHDLIQMFIEPEMMRNDSSKEK
jgi:RimJ/RimL family protein N-acetyltransferase